MSVDEKVIRIFTSLPHCTEPRREQLKDAINAEYDDIPNLPWGDIKQPRRGPMVGHSDILIRRIIDAENLVTELLAENARVQAENALLQAENALLRAKVAN